MATFFRSSQVWVIDYRYQGRERRWFKALPTGADAERWACDLLQDLYEGRATLEGVRPATPQEDADYLHDNLPRNAYCPSGKGPLSEPRPPREDD